MKIGKLCLEEGVVVGYYDSTPYTKECLEDLSAWMALVFGVFRSRNNLHIRCFLYIKEDKDFLEFINQANTIVTCPHCKKDPSEYIRVPMAAIWAKHKQSFNRRVPKKPTEYALQLMALNAIYR